MYFVVSVVAGVAHGHGVYFVVSVVAGVAYGQEVYFVVSVAGVTYGQGVYFATTAAYSEEYARTDKQTQKMFMANVLVGDYTQGTSHMKMPPLKGDRANPHLHYDCTVNNQFDPSVFVIYHDTQAYPSHIITFKRAAGRRR